MFKPVSPNTDFSKNEVELLEKWKKEKVPEKYLSKNQDAKEKFSFLDGPITANNPMGVHHAWGRTYKDIWQRFWNMRGKKQRFQNGFDCQGLWVEVEVEKELQIRNKKEIENLVPGNRKESIAKFVELCKERVIKYSKIQTEQSIRLGYFMDWDNSYYTMSNENNYMIWHFLKVCHEKNWIYKGKDNVAWCPRCETAISQHEMLTEDYKELTHESVFFKLPILTKGFEKTYLLIWTTTPWTIPANVAVAVNPKLKYKIWNENKTGDKIIILDKDELGNEAKREFKGNGLTVSEYVFGKENVCNGEYISERENIPGKELVGLKYEGPFDNLKIVKKAESENPQTFHTVVDGSKLVTADEGTGLLHVAPGAGKEDFDLGKKEKLSIISPINDDASYVNDMDEFAEKNAKKHPELIIEYLKSFEKGKFLLKTMQYTHRYPACWRCKTELVWKVTEEWYIAMDRKNPKTGKTLREEMIEVAKRIKWEPDFGLERELDWLSNMSDWLISKKNRYWGLALPVFECNKCESFDVIGGIEELKKRAVLGWDEFEGHSPHKPYIDEVKIKCSKCNELVSRINDVGNVWLDAGIVPYSTYIDPKTKELSYLTDKAYWKEWFPADFITESFPGQFKNWFYSMIAMSTVLENENPFKFVLGYASVIGEDGRPMHKSWGNMVDFGEGAEKIGVDVMRWMFATHNPEQNLLFGYKHADETRRKFHIMLWNIYNFFVTYANVDGWNLEEEIIESKNVLDKWILSRLNWLIKEATGQLEKYNSQKASVAIEEFVNDLSLWYVRRSRDRVGPSAENKEDKKSCHNTLYFVLISLSKLLAPFTPFLADEIYTNLTEEVSIHLSDWPESSNKLINEELEREMDLARKIAEAAHALRKKSQIKVRIPFKKGIYKSSTELSAQVLEVLKAEINFLDLKYLGKSEQVYIDAETDEKNQDVTAGEAREIIRSIQTERKNLKTEITDFVNVILLSWPKEYEELIKRQALIKTLTKGKKFEVKKDV